MRRLLLFFTTTFLLALNVLGKQPQPMVIPKVAKNNFKGVVKADSSTIVKRGFNNEALNNYKKLKDFDYTEVKGTNFWERFWDRVWQFILKIFSKKGKASTGGNKILGDILMIAACVFIIYALLKMLKLDGLFKRKPKDATLAYSESAEDINIIDFDKDIANATAIRNYRLAVRLLYLQSLKLLNDARLIDWQISKTNSVYIHEITDAAQKQSFKLLTRQFEYVWYGDLPIDNNSFKTIDALFSDFRRMLK
ncbi:DUF4129 domain-containing protein [Mucilaginibacter terrigena]|uniref:DUF4129 domain-containing protein n=1 Tax=Mucilaginibacter terrigena TaxID=2492395 RepID=A0A4Q5LGZ5_9SPHI|nr:DUF4129 domain-containing protein [Mucilaginibacter terrigena]RYU86152.1 DUF4129 domain-containing protein [Mucilaginibacter terrigena]